MKALLATTVWISVGSVLPGDKEAATAAETYFARNLREWRNERGMSQEELARQMAELGFPFHQGTIYKIETGARRVRLDEATVLAKVLGLDLDMLTAEPDKQRTARLLSMAVAKIVEQSEGIEDLALALLVNLDGLRDSLEVARAEPADKWLQRAIKSGEEALDEQPELPVRRAREEFKAREAAVARENEEASASGEHQEAP